MNDIVPHEPDNLAIESTLLGLFAGLCGAIPGFLYPQAMEFFGSTVWPFVQGGVGFMSGIAWTYHNLYAILPSDELSKVGFANVPIRQETDRSSLLMSPDKRYQLPPLESSSFDSIHACEYHRRRPETWYWYRARFIWSIERWHIFEQPLLRDRDDRGWYSGRDLARSTRPTSCCHMESKGLRPFLFFSLNLQKHALKVPHVLSSRMASHTFTHANQTLNLSHLISFKHGFVVANPGVFYCPWKCEWIETKKSESAPQLFLIWSVCRWRYHDPCADLEWHLICSGTLREMMTWLIFHSSLYSIDVSLGSLHTGWSQRCLRGRWRDVLLRWGWSVSPISIDKRWFKDLNSSIYIFKWVDISSEWWILFVHNWENSSLNFLGLTSCLPNTISRFRILLNTRGNASRNISPMRTTHIKTGR